MIAASAQSIARRVAARQDSAGAVVAAAIERARAVQSRTNAFTEILPEHALARAHALDAALDAGAAPGPLCGVPVVIKDNICTTAGHTTCASRILAGYRSPFDATAVARLAAAGAVVIAKANMDEFGMGSSTERSAYGPASHPTASGRVPGGSSGGSAIAVASGVVPIALGSDTGGSIRQPAAFCGVVGLKPTYGRVSRLGLVAYASSLDQIGPIAGSVADAALALRVIAGHDPADATSLPDAAADMSQPLGRAPASLRVGVVGPEATEGLHPGVRAALDRAAGALRDAGAHLVPVQMPHAEHAIAAYYLIATAEASSNLARFDGVRFGRRAALGPLDGIDELYTRSRSEGFGPEVTRRVLLGTFALSSGYADQYYGRALRARRLIKGDYDAAFAHGCHALLTPVTPGPAFMIGEKTSDPLSMYLQDAFTVGVNLAGLPALSLPMGTTPDRGQELPVGVQLVGPPMGEPALLAIAALVENAGTSHA
ncbi:MAG: Asp-tRNA(Asn)/Glu-tRNA(Gln) amidotransferase GatCAB subunit A [Planctomyces sp.]|nr:Asp-tRNA(Asn)/Glu-tRNA(Gln) amidotransferase GatCAB subunit A [Planctomyces sp.]MBA4119335.1 Asp-tRNA(Asn)/Glu-tRNA(Gln) amidotransferase GatCAB subunit A [Isosphaera sp.]